MLTTLLITLFLGIIGGILLLTLILLYLFQVKCPKCKQLRPVKEIALFQWKTKQITGQPCSKCREIKPQIDIEL